MRRCVPCDRFSALPLPAETTPKMAARLPTAPLLQQRTPVKRRKRPATLLPNIPWQRKWPIPDSKLRQNVIEKTFARSESTLWQGKGIVWGYANSRLFYSLTDGAKEILLSPTPDFRSPASSRNNSLRASINLNAKAESKSEAVAPRTESEVAPKNDELPPRRQTPPTKLAPSRFKKRWNLSQHLLVTEPSYTILCWCSNF